MTNEAWHTVYLGLGTNLGNRMENLASARQALSPDILVLEVSPIYETRPWGFSEQPDFFNQVVKAQTALAPLDLLAYLKQCEIRLGRTPTFKNGPRVVDLDVLFYDDLVYASATLTIPHPAIPDRAFVLVPLADIAPDLRHPVSGKTVCELFAQVDSRDVKRIYP